MKRRDFLEASAIVLLLAGCNDGSSPKPSENATLLVDGEHVYTSDAVGNLFRAHRRNNLVSRLNIDGAPAWTVGGSGTRPLQFDLPVALAADRYNRLYVLDRGNGRVQVLDTATGAYLGTIGKSGAGVGALHFARDLAVAGDRLYIADQLDHSIEVFDLAGGSLGTIGSFGTGSGELNAPRSVAVDAAGLIYVADPGSRQLKRYHPDGSYAGAIGSPTLADPRGVAIDSAGDVWVADGGSSRVVVLQPDGVVVRGFDTRFADGKLAGPHDIAVVGSTIYIRAVDNGPA